MKFLGRLMRRREPSSREIARERLEDLLEDDRNKIASPSLETLKNELIATISRHVDIDVDGVEVTLTRRGMPKRLIANFPLRSPRMSFSPSRERRL